MQILEIPQSGSTKSKKKKKKKVWLQFTWTRPDIVNQCQWQSTTNYLIYFSCSLAGWFNFFWQFPINPFTHLHLSNSPLNLMLLTNILAKLKQSKPGNNRVPQMMLSLKQNPEYNTAKFSTPCNMLRYINVCTLSIFFV